MYNDFICYNDNKLCRQHWAYKNTSVESCIAIKVKLWTKHNKQRKKIKQDKNNRKKELLEPFCRG